LAFSPAFDLEDIGHVLQLVVESDVVSVKIGVERVATSINGVKDVEVFVHGAVFADEAFVSFA
jgi:hypothetical protein